MTSKIRNYSDNIDTNFPVQGRDNPSQGFRDNFAQIKLALLTAAEELETVAISAINTFTLTPATTATIGGVKIGSGFRVNPDGTIFIDEIYTLPAASATVLGGVKQGDNVTIAGDGTISVATPYVLPTASGSTLGGVKVGFGLEINGSGVLSVNTATEFPYDVPLATSGVAGVVKIGANIAVSGDGTISVTAPYQLPAATDNILGGVKQGNNVTIAGDGTISVAAPYVLPVATTSTLGGVIAGAGININGSGVISAPYSYTLPNATTSTLGGVIIGDNITVIDGVISVAAPYVLPVASNITRGGIKIGNGLTIDGGGFLSVAVTPPDLSAITEDLLPNVDVTYDLGSPLRRWKDLYLSTSTIYLGDVTISASGGTINIPSLSSSKLGVLAAGVVTGQTTVNGDIRYTVDRDYFKNNAGVYGPFVNPPVIDLTNNQFYQDEPNSKPPVLRVELDANGYISDIIVDDPGYFPPNGSYPFLQDGFSIEPTANEPITLIGKNIGAIPPAGGTYSGTFNGQPFTYTWDGNEGVGEEPLVGVNTTYGALKTWRLTYGYYKFVGSTLVQIDQQEFTSIAGSSPVLVINGSLDWSVYWDDLTNFPSLNFVACEAGDINFTSGTLAASGDLKVDGGATVSGSLTVKTDITFADGTILTSAIPTLPLYTTSTLSTIVSTATGAMVLVTDLVGGSLPCFYDGTNWKTFTGTII